MKFTTAQEKAYSAFGDNFLISAGAGSGKTQVISERVKFAIETYQYRIQDFLILTFTDLAAGEMKDRIRKKLIEINSIEANYVDNAFICTFDSYALSIVKKYHYLIDVDKSLSLLNENVYKVLIYNKINKILNCLYEEKDPILINFIEKYLFKDEKQLQDIIYDIFKACDESRDSNYLNILLNKQNTNMVYEVLNNFSKKLDSYVENLQELYIEIPNENTKEKALKILNGYYEYTSLDEKVKYVREWKFKGNYDDKEIQQEISYIREKIKKFVENYTSEKILLNDVAVNYKNSEFLINIVKEVKKYTDNYKKTNQLFTFNDIAKMAIKIFEEHKEVAEEVKNSFKSIMIDEYQDTSALQEDFIKLIANNNVYQVGDIKQSIYRFRKATPEIFINKFAKYSQNHGGNLITLNDNFRSRGEVLNDINDIFSQMMTLELGGADYKKDHIIGIGNKEYLTTTQNYNLEVIKYNECDDNYIEEATLIALDIIQKIKSEYKIFDKEAKELRNIRLSDICILMDRGSEFDKFRDVFAKYKIPTFIESNVDISKHPITLVLGNVLKVIYYLINGKKIDKQFNHSFLSIGRSFIYNCSDEELYNIIKNQTILDSEIIKDLKKLIKDYKNESVFTLISKFVERKEVYHKLVQLGDMLVNEKYLDDFMENLSLLQKTGFQLEDYIDYLDQIKELDITMDVSSSTTDFDAVRIMNIFKSKGLEFPLIYCAGLHKEFNRRNYTHREIVLSNEYGIIFPDHRHKKTIIAGEYHAKDLKDDISEKIRLLYVELTRAKEKIICLIQNEKPTKSKKKIKKLIDSTSLAELLIPYISKFNAYEIVKEDIKYIPNDTNKEFINLILEDFSLNIIEKNEQRRASKALNIEANKKMLLTGERLHFNLEVIDFMKPDYSLIENDFEKNLIKKFLSLPLIKNLKNPKFFKEYEFNDEIHLTNGIIDCLIIDNNEAMVIDYKLKNIDDEKYSKQLKVYVDFVVSYFKIHTKCYLYSILDGTLKEIVI